MTLFDKFLRIRELGIFSIIVVFVIVASIIELMIEESKEPYSYSDLLLAIEKFRNLFKAPNSRLTDEELKGLWGELWFLKEVIFRCRSREEMEQCLNSWKGSELAKRDFRFPDSKIIFEIKIYWDFVKEVSRAVATIDL